MRACPTSNGYLPPPQSRIVASLSNDRCFHAPRKQPSVSGVAFRHIATAMSNQSDRMDNTLLTSRKHSEVLGVARLHRFSTCRLQSDMTTSEGFTSFTQLTVLGEGLLHRRAT
jgi:hypothetical protein